MKIVVYTCITGGKDRVLDQQETGNAEFILYSDTNPLTKTWKVLPAYDKFKDNRRNSRIQKIMPHLFFDADYSIYIDGNMKLLASPEKIIEMHLKDHDIAVFRHPNRDCLYDEAITCAKLKLDGAEAIIEQAKWYDDHRFATKKGLFECGVIIRRHTDKVRRLNEAWWAEYCRFGVRDQISFPVAVDKSATRVNKIDEGWVVTEEGRFIKGGIIEIVPHKILNEWAKN